MLRYITLWALVSQWVVVGRPAAPTVQMEELLSCQRPIRAFIANASLFLIKHFFLGSSSYGVLRLSAKTIQHLPTLCKMRTLARTPVDIWDINPRTWAQVQYGVHARASPIIIHHHHLLATPTSNNQDSSAGECDFVQFYWEHLISCQWISHLSSQSILPPPPSQRDEQEQLKYLPCSASYNPSSRKISTF